MSSVHIDGSTYSIMGLQMHIALPYFAILLIGELVAAARWYITGRGKLYRWNDSFSSLACGITQQMFSKLLLATVANYSYCYVYHYMRLSGSDGFWSANAWLAHAVAFLLIDHQYYWFHRFSHEINVGWFGHVPHHSSEEYNLSTSLRQGMFQASMAWPFYLPIAILGITPELYGIHSQINLLYQFWIHTRAVDKLPLAKVTEYVLNTPSHHRVHHGRNPEYIDKNYGGVLIVFDRLYGTFEQEGREVVYGLVHPLQTFNPMHTQTHHMVDMIEHQSRYSTIKQKLQVFLCGPGFNPETQTTFDIPEVPPVEEVQKYDPQIPSYLVIYVMIQFTVQFVLGVIYMTQDMSTVMTTELATLTANVTQFCYIFGSLSSIALIFERGATAMYQYEWWRLFGTLAFVAYSHIRFDDQLTLFLWPKIFYTQMQQEQFDYGYSAMDYMTVFTILSLVFASVTGYLTKRNATTKVDSGLDETRQMILESLSANHNKSATKIKCQ